MAFSKPGIFTLAALPLAAPKAMSLLTPIVDLDGMTGVSLECSFQYGSGGAACSAIAATSFDGVVWRHIARFDFTTATAVKIANLSGLLSKGVTSYADLSSEGVMDGVLGSQLAAFIVSSGTYVNSVLSLKASLR